MYFVPQVRSAVANLRLSEISHPMRCLIELYANMDLAQLAALVDDELIPSLGISPIEVSKIGDVSVGKRLSPLHFTSLVVELFSQRSSQRLEC